MTSGPSLAFIPCLATRSEACYRRTLGVPICGFQQSSYPAGGQFVRIQGRGPLIESSRPIAYMKAMRPRAQAAKRSKRHRVKPAPVQLAPKKLIVLQRTGMNFPVVLSKELQELVGTDMMTRGEILAKLCQYIKENKLNVEGNKQYFYCNETFQKLFKVDGKYRLLELQTLIKPHLTRPSALGKDYEERANKLFQKYLEGRNAISSADVGRSKNPRAMNSVKAQRELYAKGLGMYAEVELSPSIRRICGGKEKMARPKILQSVWNYIKSNELQDAKHRRIIILNDDLREALQITDRDSVDCFELPKYIWRQTGGQARKIQ